MLHPIKCNKVVLIEGKSVLELDTVLYYVVVIVPLIASVEDDSIEVVCLTISCLNLLRLKERPSDYCV